MPRILAGMDQLVNAELRGNYEHARTFRRVMTRPADVDWKALVSKAASQIDTNWDGRSSRSTKNWRSTPQGTIAAGNRSREKIVEKGVVQYLPGWTNQVPTCSGVNGSSDRKRSIDLAYMNGTELELIELKIASDTPLLAAIEVLYYGLLYRFSRAQATSLGYNQASNPFVCCGATAVHLKVLAPQSFYAPRALVPGMRTMADMLSDALNSLPPNGYRMSFIFEAFGRSFVAPTSPALVTRRWCLRVFSGRRKI
jgi:hypothetical protein